MHGKCIESLLVFQEATNLCHQKEEINQRREEWDVGNRGSI